MGHFVSLMAALISQSVVVMKAREFAETVEGVLLEGAQSLDGVGWVVREPVLTAAEAAQTPNAIVDCFFGDLSRAKLFFFFIPPEIVKTQTTSKKREN